MSKLRGLTVAAALLAWCLPGVTAPRLAAQAHPDFSGTWTVESVNHSGGGGRGDTGGPGGRGGMGGGFGGPGGPGGGFGGRFGGRGGRGGRGGPGGPGGPGGDADGERPRPGGGAPAMYQVGEVVTVRQTDGLLISTRQTERGSVMSSYRLDGAEVKTEGLRGGHSTSRSRWDGAALVSELSQAFESPRGTMKMKSREVRTLGPAPDRMTLTITTDGPRGKDLTTVVFGRRDTAAEAP